MPRKHKGAKNIYINFGPVKTDTGQKNTLKHKKRKKSVFVYLRVGG